MIQDVTNVQYTLSQGIKCGEMLSNLIHLNLERKISNNKRTKNWTDCFEFNFSIKSKLCHAPIMLHDHGVWIIQYDLSYFAGLSYSMIHAGNTKWRSDNIDYGGGEWRIICHSMMLCVTCSTLSEHRMLAEDPEIDLQIQVFSSLFDSDIFVAINNLMHV